MEGIINLKTNSISKGMVALERIFDLTLGLMIGYILKVMGEFMNNII
jgi:hypothetical protein